MNQLKSWVSAQPAARAAGLLILVIIVALIVQPIAITNYGVTLDRVTDAVLVAVGLTLVVVLGEIDLSVGSTMALVAVMVAKFSENLPVGILIGLLVGVAIGIVNAFLVLVVKVNSFIATLGTMTAIAGLALLVSSNNPIPMASLDAAIAFTDNLVGQFTIPAVIMVLITAVMAVFMGATSYGREFYAVGGNIDAARAADIKVTAIKTIGFVMCSVLAAVAGILETIRQASGDPKLGGTVLLLGIAGAVLGGGVLTGGRGSVVGAALGSLALGLIAVTLELAGVSASIEQVITGVILFIAVVSNTRGIAGLRLDIWRRRLRPA